MWKNTINLIGIGLFFILGLYSFVFGQAAVTEQLTLTTYYPSPAGNYAELTVQGGTTVWTTNGWAKALIIGGDGGEAIQFTNSGAGVQHFGLGAAGNNDFFGWYTSTNTAAGDSAHNWLHVDASAAPVTITLDNEVRATGQVLQFTGSAGAPSGCMLLNYGSTTGQTDCPAGYTYNAALSPPVSATGGIFYCCN